MITARQIEDLILKGISRFIKPLNQSAEDIQVVFKLKEIKKDDKVIGHEVSFIICVYEQPTNTVHLKDLIGNNIYNPLVKSHIKKLLEKFAADNDVALNNIILMAGVRDKVKVYILLKNNKELIREITNPDELK